MILLREEWVKLVSADIHEASLQVLYIKDSLTTIKKKKKKLLGAIAKAVNRKINIGKRKIT
ncbi:MAG TPA: hypothetical protein ENI51_08440, partial [Candidatus Atribacteria bacterium]|nr:hypothetical protein [Candidatus Atribacteria bacterium]